MGKDYVCNKCGYKWISRKGQDAPAYCPRCASKKIEIDEQEVSEINKDKLEISKCDYCGKNVTQKVLIGECQWRGILGRICFGSRINKKSIYQLLSKQLCEKCAKECKNCGKLFCPKHLDNHKCE